MSVVSEPPEEHVLGDDGRFHAVDEEVRLSVYGGEDWIVLAVFWALAAVVFYQVFTRYVLNDAAGWTEEIARYLLVAVTFLGGAMAVRRNTHIQVDFVYRFLPAAAGRALSIFVDVVRAAFLGYAVWLTWPGFALMFARALQLAWKHWRRGYSVLERPDALQEDKA